LLSFSRLSLFLFLLISSGIQDPAMCSANKDML